jgi:hypothetical protein
VVACLALVAVPDQVAVQGPGDCSWCVHCGLDGIETFQGGASPWDIAYLVTSGCERFPQGCEALISCDDVQHDEDAVLAAIDSRDTAVLRQALEDQPSIMTVVPERNIVMVRGCTGVAAIRSVSNAEMALFLEMGVATADG